MTLAFNTKNSNIFRKNLEIPPTLLENCDLSDSPSTDTKSVIQENIPNEEREKGFQKNRSSQGKDQSSKRADQGAKKPDQSSRKTQRSDRCDCEEELNWNEAATSFVQLFLAFTSILCFLGRLIIILLNSIFFTCCSGSRKIPRPSVVDHIASSDDSCDRLNESSMKKRRLHVTKDDKSHFKSPPTKSVNPSHKRTKFKPDETVAEQISSKINPDISIHADKIIVEPSDPNPNLNPNPNPLREDFSQNCSIIPHPTESKNSRNYSDGSTQTNYCVGFTFPGDASAINNFQSVTGSFKRPDVINFSNNQFLGEEFPNPFLSRAIGNPYQVGIAGGIDASNHYYPYPLPPKYKYTVEELPQTFIHLPSFNQYSPINMPLLHRYVPFEMHPKASNKIQMDGHHDETSNPFKTSHTNIRKFNKLAFSMSQRNRLMNKSSIDLLSSANPASPEIRKLKKTDESRNSGTLLQVARSDASPKYDFNSDSCNSFQSTECKNVPREVSYFKERGKRITTVPLSPCVDVSKLPSVATKSPGLKLRRLRFKEGDGPKLETSISNYGIDSFKTLLDYHVDKRSTNHKSKRFIKEDSKKYNSSSDHLVENPMKSSNIGLTSSDSSDRKPSKETCKTVIPKHVKRVHYSNLLNKSDVSSSESSYSISTQGVSSDQSYDGRTCADIMNCKDKDELLEIYLKSKKRATLPKSRFTRARLL